MAHRGSVPATVHVCAQEPSIIGKIYHIFVPQFEGYAAHGYFNYCLPDQE